jgi:hypothetical protein
MVSRAGFLCCWFATLSGRTVRPPGMELRECLFGYAGIRRCTGRRTMATRRRRWHWSRRARTCTARTTSGTVLGLDSCVVGLPHYRGGRSVHLGWSCGSAYLAMQESGAAPGVAQWPHGDGDGTGQGGRGRALQGQRRVRFSVWILVSVVCRSAGRTVRPLGAELLVLPVLAVQGYGAARCVVERQDGDCDGAREGGRGRALQEQGWVRFSGCVLVGLSQCRVASGLLALCATGN